MRERRRSRRAFLKGRVYLSLGGKDYEFPLADISVSGVGVMLDVAILGTKPSGAVGICRIESPELPHPVEAFASVMRIRRVGQQFLVGLRFESISDEQLHILQAYEARARGGLESALPV